MSYDATATASYKPPKSSATIIEGAELDELAKLESIARLSACGDRLRGMRARLGAGQLGVSFVP